MAYVTDISNTRITITFADQFRTDTLVTSDDIYSARAAPSYDSFLAQHTVFHPQHIRDYVASEHQKCSLQLHQYIQCDFPIMQHIYDIPELEWPDGTESWHFHDVKPRRKLSVKRIIHPLDLANLCSTPAGPELELNSIDSSAKSVSMLDELPSSIPIVPFVHYSLRESQTIFQPAIIPHISNFKQHWSHSMKNDKIKIASCSSRKPSSVRSNHDYRHRFFRLIVTNVAPLPFVLLLLLLRFGIIHHSVDNADGIGDHSHSTELKFLFDSTISTNSKQTFNTFIPYVTTIETLRALESILIYAVT